MNTPDKIKFISCLQILGVILVIVYHSFHEYPGGAENCELARIIATVHMPLFVFISGYLFNFSRLNRKQVPFSRFFIGKVRRLIVPYFFLGAITFMPRAWMSAYADDPIVPSLENFIRSFLFTDSLVIVYFWFLPAIFIILNFMFICMKAFRNFENIFISLLALAAVAANICIHPYSIKFLALGQVLHLLVFFIAGMLYVRCQNWIIPRLNSITSFIILMAAWLLIWHFGYTASHRLLCSFAGIAACLAFSHIVSARVNSLGHLEGFSYMLYLLSWYTAVFSQQVLHAFTRWEWWVYTLLAIITSIYIPWSIGKILMHSAKNHRWARICLTLLGHSSPKNGRSAESSSRSRTMSDS